MIRMINAYNEITQSKLIPHCPSWGRALAFHPITPGEFDHLPLFTIQHFIMTNLWANTVTVNLDRT